MEPSAERAFAHTIWAAHILSDLSASHDKLIDDERVLDPNGEPEEDDDQEDDIDLGADIGSDINDSLISPASTLREKSLDCIAELLSRKKGWHFVTAATLREQEDSVEIDVARNFGFDTENDEDYMGLLRDFIAEHTSEQTGSKHGITCSSFLTKTIEYYSGRIDGLTVNAKSIWNQAPVSSPSQSNAHGSAIDSYNQRCILDFRGKHTDSTVQILRQFTMTLLRRSRRPIHRRRKLVLLAYASVLSKTLPEILSQTIERTKVEKALKTLKLLSRPVTNLQILALAARTLPSFQSLRFCIVTPPSVTQIRKQYIIPLRDAWDRLELPPLPQNFETRIRKADMDFKENCSRKFSCHAEVQLVQRYEESPWLIPSIEYIGCSKKACLLCESFLELSPWHPKLRGRHGSCHPRWGVSLITVEHQTPRLEKLVRLLKNRILKLVEGGISAADPVAQSSLISALDTLDINGMDERAALRQAAKNEEQDLRERLAILNDPRSRGPQNIWYTDSRTLCVMCQWPSAGKYCKGCHSCCYCSKRCQSIDWPSHKLLCSRYKRKLSSRPSPNHRLGIWFDRDNNSPKLVWIGFKLEGSIQWPIFDDFLGPLHGIYCSLPFSDNQRRGLGLDYSLSLYYHDYGEVRNKSIYATAAISGTSVPHDWFDHVVAMSGQTGAGHFGDVTLADFRYFLDYFATSWDDTIRDNPSYNSIRGVQVNNVAEQLLHGVETFTPVSVASNFPKGDGLSASLSKVLGIAVTLYRIKNNAITVCRLDATPPSEDSPVEPENPYYTALLLSVDESSEKWGTPDTGWEINVSFQESFLLLRDDGDDLDLDDAVCLCRYCDEVLRPLFEKSMGGGGDVTRRDVIEAARPEKLVEFGLKSKG